MAKMIPVVVGLTLLVSAVARGDAVHRRGTAPALEGRIIDFDDAGVTVRSALGARHFVPWDRVRRVDADIEDPDLQPYLHRAVDLWRARSRVERNDTTLAEPILERLFERYRGRTHETALVVAEGLLRCRIARADHVLAVIPALEAARLRRAGVTTDSYATLPPVLAPSRSLCTVLAPAWLPSPLLGSLAHDLQTYDAKGDAVVAELARLYRLAVLQSLGETPVPARADVPAAEANEDARLLRLLIESGVDDPAARRAARLELETALPRLPEWGQAWARYHLGCSLLRESGAGRQQQGLVSLLHLPARYGSSQPYLAGIALVYVSDVLDRWGDHEAATGLRMELRERFPYHPLHAVAPRGLRGATRQEDDE